MPSSRPNIIPTVIHLLRQLRPRSILDVGVGFGKWGHLFREYTDILEAERDPKRYQREHWRVRIDGIEGHAAYLTPMHRYLYNEIHIGEASQLLPQVAAHDLIFLGDIIEHFEKEAGMALMRVACERAQQAVVVSTPRYETDQEDLCGNELERHRSLWTPEDFAALPGGQVVTVDDATLLAVFTKPGTPALRCTPPHQPSPADQEKFRRARSVLVSQVPAAAGVIVIDEEQWRGNLPLRTSPFLEKSGVYWGPPADDATAIAELERMIQAGAGWLAVFWTSRWWLDAYPGFAAHLRQSAVRQWEDDAVTLFRLGTGSQAPS